MQKRLCGREQEFGVFIDPVPDLDYRDQFREWHRDIYSSLIVAISKRFPSVILNNKDKPEMVWLGNGSKIYIDIGRLIESNTAECLAGSLDIVAQEKALEQILNLALKQVSKIWGLRRFELYKNSVGPGRGDDEDEDIFTNTQNSVLDLRREVTYGCHHNYSYLLAKERSISDILWNFIPAALILSGNGHVARKRNGGFVFNFSQRTPHVLVKEMSDGDNLRPLIDYKNEDRADSSLTLGRLHLMSRDATRCELQTWLVDTITHLVLRLGEEGWNLPAPLRLEDPVKELHKLNFGIDLNYRLRTRTSRANIIRYNRIFLNAAKQLRPLSPEEKRCLEEWERVLELLEAKALDKLVGELDWVTKRHLLEKGMKKFGFGLEDNRAWRIDWDYHNISADPRISLYAALEERGTIRRLVSQEDIKRAITTSPGTRAKSRGRFIRLLRKNKRFLEKLELLEWDHAVLGHRGRSINVYFGEDGNPFSTDSPSLDELQKIILKGKTP